MRPYRLALLVVVFLAPAGAYAQLDSTFVELLNNKWRVHTGLRYRDRGTIFSVDEREELKLSNEGLAFQIGGRWRSLGYTFNIPLSDLGTGTDEQDSRSLGLNLQLFRPRYFLNLRARETKGFRSIRPDQPERFRENIKLLRLEVFGFWVMSYRRFSLRASFKQRSRQLQSQGSFIVGGLLSRQRLDTDGLNVPLNSGDVLPLDRFSQNKIGIGGGYAFTHLFSEKWYVTPMLFAGPEFRFVTYKPVGDEDKRERFRVSPRLRARLAFGYNAERRFAALTAAYLPSLDNTDQLDTRLEDTEVRLLFGLRF